MYKQDSALNNQQWLICQKTKPNQIKQSLINNKIIWLNYMNVLSL